MCNGAKNRKISMWLLLVLCLLNFEEVLPEKSNKRGLTGADFLKGCTNLRCRENEECVNRKFLCKNPPCPSMLYCSKSRKESLKGPSSCETVRCTKGFICLVRVRHCLWDEGCEQQIARCVPERDYYEGPASCIDFRCPFSYKCILRESLCLKPPCKLLKSCAKAKDVKTWLNACKSLGCLSEQECFLRRPLRSCFGSSCKHSPDCSARTAEELENKEQCRGWVCPKGEDCSADTESPCTTGNCKVSRVCHKQLITLMDPKKSVMHTWREDLMRNFNTEYAEALKKIKGNLRSTGFNNNSLISNSTISDMTDNSIRKITKSMPSSTDPTPDESGTKPTVASLSMWLNHLKLVTGVDAVEVWISRANNHEKYEEFLQWLQSLKDILGPEAYDLWLEEVRAMSVTSSEFQKWLPAPSSNRSISAPVNNNDPNIFGNSSSSPISATGGNNEDQKDRKPEINIGSTNPTPVLSNDVTSRFLSTTQNPSIEIGNSNSNLPQLPPISELIGLAKLLQLYLASLSPLQAYPVQPNLESFGPWIDPASSYDVFQNGALLNSDVPLLLTNWTSQQSLQNNPDFNVDLTSQNQFLPPNFPGWQFNGTSQNTAYLDPRYFQPIPEEIISRGLGNPWGNFHFSNWTNYNESPENPEFFGEILGPHHGSIAPELKNQMTNSFPFDWSNQNVSLVNPPTIFGPVAASDEKIGGLRNQMENLKHIRWWDYGSYPMTYWTVINTWRSLPPGTSETFPTFDRNAGNANWPDSSFPGKIVQDVRSYSPAPERRGIEFGDFSHRINPTNSRLSPRFMEPKIQDYHTYLSDYSNVGKNFYEKNNPDGSPLVLPYPGLSKTHRVGADPLLSDLRGPYNEDRISQHPEDRRGNFYPRDHRLDTTMDFLQENPSPSSFDPANIDRTLNSSSNLDPFHFDDYLNPVDSYLGHRSHASDIPEQSVPFPDLRNSRFENPSDEISPKTLRGIFDHPEKRTGSAFSKPSSPASRKMFYGISPASEENLGSRIEMENDRRELKDFLSGNEEVIYPLLLSLEGYIESPTSQIFHDSSPNEEKNSTILPVYSIDNDPRRSYDDDYNAEDATPENFSSNHREINFFRNVKYGGRADLPEYLKSVVDSEASLIMQNRTGGSRVQAEDMKWEQGNDGAGKVSRFFSPSGQGPVSSGDRSLGKDPPHGWTINTAGAWNDGRTETDYYDERLDYGDGMIPADRASIDPVQMSDRRSIHNGNTPGNLDDPFYDRSDHKRFKKNRPL